MNSHNTEIIDFELDKLEELSGVIGIAIVNRNGLLITSRLPREIDGRKLGAMAATMFESVEIATANLGSQNIHHLTVEFDEFQVFMLGITAQMIIITVLERNSNIGLVLIEIEESIQKIKNYK